MPGIYAFSMQPWSDQQLTKNCGLLPYLFHRNYGWRAVMAGPRGHASYPSLRYLPGVTMEFWDDASSAAACAYVAAHAQEIDVLCLHGLFDAFFPLVARYRAARPDGKIYLELDANIHYESRIDWATPWMRAFLSACDVIGASCHAMQRHLGATWPVAIDYLPNGFFDYTGAFRPMTDADFAAKENIILTVGRIGTRQKRNDILLEAFAQATAQGALADWRLVLVGNVTDAFRADVDRFFECHPELSRRVELTGPIFDKSALYQQYRRAKVFALTSQVEGGAPNVVAEALLHGCAMVTSDIDAWEDIIDDGRCGGHFPIGDAAALASVLTDLCSDEARLAAFGRHATAYGARTQWFEHIAAELYYLLYQRRPGA